MELKGKKINFLGDSITQGVGTSAPEHIYHAVLAKEYGAVARNYGISGTRFARQSSNSANPSFDQNFCDRVEKMDADADVIVVFGGTNDFGHGDAPIGTPSDREYTTFYGACHQLFSSLIKKYPAAVIAIMTPLHRANEDNPRGDGNKPTDVGRLIDYVRIIREVAEEYALPVLDLYAFGGIQPKLEEQRVLYAPDGLHPNDAGHVVIARKLGKFLENL
ncbi:MAG: SGNH/GDSL hydrolase family protein [Clostridia bacterium]|nr:SGNH/GDSL hydrolase family protein [Clostridia bacterium]